MSANAKKLSNIDAADKIYEIIINLVSKWYLLSKL